MDLKTFLHFQDSQCFISLEDLQLKGTGNIFSVLIPCEDLENVDISFFETNCICVENRYVNYTSPLIAHKAGEYPLLLENNDALITTRNVFNDEKKEIPHISINHKGWYLLKELDFYSIYCDMPQDLLYCEVECYSQNINYDIPPFFEDFVPAKLKWFIKPCSVTKYDQTSEVSKIVQLFYEDYSLTDYFRTLIDFVNIKDEKIKIIELNITDSVKPVFIGNYLVSQVGKLINIYCETKDYILLKCISKTIQNKYECFIDIIFHIDNKKIILEKESIKM